MTEIERLRAALRLAIGVAEAPCREALAIARHELRCSMERVA